MENAQVTKERNLESGNYISAEDLFDLIPFSGGKS